MLRASIAACAAAAAFATPASAVTSDDVHCFMLMGRLLGDEAAGTRDAASLGTFYFAGKLMAADPAIDLNSAVAAETATFGSLDTEVLGRRCGAELQALGDRLEAMDEDAAETEAYRR